MQGPGSGGHQHGENYLWPFVVTLSVILAQLLLIGTLLIGRQVGTRSGALTSESALRTKVEKDATMLQTRRWVCTGA